MKFFIGIAFLFLGSAVFAQDVASVNPLTKGFVNDGIETVKQDLSSSIAKNNKNSSKIYMTIRRVTKEIPNKKVN